MFEIGNFGFLQICVPALLCAFILDHKYLNHWFLTLPKSDKAHPLPHYCSKSNPWLGSCLSSAATEGSACFYQTPSVKHEVFPGSFVVTAFTKGSQILPWSHSKVRNVHQDTSWTCACHSQLSLSLFPSLSPSTSDLGTKGELEHQVGLSALPAVPGGAEGALVSHLEMLRDGIFSCQVAKHEHTPGLKYTFGQCILKNTLSFKSRGLCPATGSGCQ